jgi:hypothetical protein
MMQASPVVFHSVIISILFQHYKQLMELTGMKNRVGPQTWIQPVAQIISQTKLDDYCLTNIKKAGIVR